jgi:GxxExxY protein
VNAQTQNPSHSPIDSTTIMNSEPAIDHASELAMPNERLTHAIIGAAIEVHRHLGPGLFESIYERAMAHELAVRGIPFRSQVAIPMTYKGVPVGDYFADLIIADRVIVELKAVAALHNAHVTQVVSYLRSTNLHLGLLINFNTPVLVKGVKRVIR